MIVTKESLFVRNSNVLRDIMKISRVTKPYNVNPSFRPKAIANKAVCKTVCTSSPGAGSRYHKEIAC